MRKRGKINFWILGGIIIILVVAIGGYIGVQGSPSVIENIYIESMQRQDYTRAFSVIDGQQFMLNGRHMTQAQFIQEAQAIDSHEGKITSVREDKARTDSGGNERTVTFIFSRGQKSYQVQLILKIVNGNFLTPLFDNYPYKIVSVSRL